MDQKVDQKVTKIGKYEIVSELGQGGMGVVYKARDPFIGRMVALKTITPELVSDPEILKRFYREAQSAGTLQHPNIVTIFDLGEADGRPYIAMEYVEGESLQAIINRRARIPLAAKLKLVQQFCEGLAHAHKHGFVHRDVKPGNILVTNDGNVKVVDFGIVHLESTNLTKTGMFLGTIHYASPEQINDGRVDNRSDLWSVTAVFYEFIAYKKAFDGSNIAAIIAKVLSTDPEPLSRICEGVPVEIDAVISKGLQKNVEQRYQSLDEMLGDVLPIARNLQQSFIGDLMTEARDLRGRGDFGGAQEKIKAILILDNTHGEAKRLHGEISSEIQRAGPLVKAKKLITEAEQAFSRGEYAEAARMLGEAQTLNPADTQARNLMSKALREQDRVRELQDALTSGQKAMKQGDLTSAEQELHRVLQLDQNNPQAVELLEQIRQDRHNRERDFRLKEALWQVDNLVQEGKYEESQNRLLELQQDFPNSEEVHQKLQILDPLIRSRKLAKDGETAFQHGEFAEAVKLLGEAIELNPRDSAALQMRDQAVQERDRLRQVREALSAGQRAMRQNDAAAAEAAFQKALQLDPSNAQATSLLGQIRQSHAAREREANFRGALQHIDALIAKGSHEEAQRGLQELQQEFPDSKEIDQKLLAIDQQMKIVQLFAEGQNAFNQGEFGEAVRLLSEAEALAPKEIRIRELKSRAVQERDRLRQMREAVAAGQRAMRNGDLVVADREYQKALKLDPASEQTKGLLAEVEKERQARERVKKLKEALLQVDKLITGKKFDDAQRKLADLQRAYPDAEEVQQKIQLLNAKRLEATPAPTPQRTTPVNDAVRSMQAAQELRRSMETPRGGEAAGGNPQATMQGPPMLEQDPAAHGATMMLSGAGIQEQLAAEKRAMQAGAATQVQRPPSPQPGRQAPPRVGPGAAAKPASKGMSPMIIVAIVVVVLALGGGAFLMLHHPSTPTETSTTTNNQQVPTPNNDQQEKDLFAQAQTAQSAQKWDDAIRLYTQVAVLNGSLKDQAMQAITVVKARQQGADVSQIEKDQFQQASTAFKKKDYSKAEALYKSVIQLKVPDSTLAPQAQSQLDQLEPLLKAKAEFDSAAGAQNRGDLQNALKQFQAIADKPGDYQAEAKARIPKLNEMINNAGALQEYNAALQTEKSGNMQGALDQFKAIASKGGPFKGDAQTQIQQINDQQAAAASQQQWDAAVKAQAGGDLQGALAQFKALASKPGPKQSDAQLKVQDLSDKIAEQQSQQAYAAANQAQSSGDLKSALAQFKAIAAKPGPMRDAAEAKAELVAQLISDANKPKTPVVQASNNPPPANSGPSSRTGTVTLIPSGDYQRWNGPVTKGMMLPDSSVEGGLKPINTSLPPIAGAPAGAVVIFIINIDPNGDVSPGRKTVDDNGLGPQVMSAAKAWKFNPPMAKGKPVSTSIQVKVSF